MTIYLMPIIILNSFFIEEYIKEIELDYHEVVISSQNERIIRIVVLILAQFMFLSSINIKGSIPYYFFAIIEFSIFSLLAIQDELHLEISLNLLLFYLATKLGWILIHRNGLINWTFFFSNLIYFSIFFISEKGIGLGDVILNSIMTLGTKSFLKYLIFFTTTFSIGAVISILGILTHTLQRKDKVGFVKFMIVGYLFTFYLGLNYV